MCHLKVFIPIALLLTISLSLFIGSHVIAEVKSDCQTDSPVSSLPKDPNPLAPPPCTCPAANPFEYDIMQSGVTIAPGSSTTVAVKGGCPPYTWGDPGHGYSWAGGSSTMGPSNVLMCAPDTGGG